MNDMKSHTSCLLNFTQCVTEYDVFMASLMYLMWKSEKYFCSIVTCYDKICQVTRLDYIKNILFNPKRVDARPF